MDRASQVSLDFALMITVFVYVFILGRQSSLNKLKKKLVLAVHVCFLIQLNFAISFSRSRNTMLGFWVGSHWTYRSIYEKWDQFEYLPNQGDSSGVALLITPGCSSRTARETQPSVYHPFIHSRNNAHNSQPQCPAPWVQDACTEVAHLFKGWRQRQLSSSQPRFMGTMRRHAPFNAPGVETWGSSRHLWHCSRERLTMVFLHSGHWGTRTSQHRL